MARGISTPVVAGLILLCVGTAQASPFSIRIGAATTGNGTLNTIITGDTLSNIVAVTYAEKEQVGGTRFFTTTNFQDNAASLLLGPLSTIINPFGFTNTEQLYTIDDPTFVYGVVDRDGLTNQQTGYTFSFSLLGSVSPTGVATFQSLSGGTVLGSTYVTLASTTTVTTDPVTSVPLPASIPLFGTALATLGLVGLGIERKSKTA